MSETEERFEEVLERLENIVATLENGGLGLEDAMKLYEEGIQKSGKLNTMLTDAREQVMKLVADENGEASLEPFEGSGDE